MNRICAVCGQEVARFVCQNCGKAICERCFVPARWLCAECSSRRLEGCGAGSPVGVGRLGFPREVMWFMVSFLMILVGIALIVISVGSGSLTGGALVFIGPIPIVIGQETTGQALAVIGVFAVFMLIALWLWKLRRQIEIL